MERFNLFAGEIEYDADDPEHFRAGWNRFGPKIGATLIGGTIYELPPGQSNCPYHYEYPNEEWLIVLAGTPTIRHPAGEDELEPGDVVCFRVGPEGAHRISNQSDQTARVLLLSTKVDPAVVVYPDSGKIAVWSGNPDDHVIVRRESHVDYWTGET